MTVREIIEATSCPSCGSPIGRRCRPGRLCPRRRGKAEMVAGWMERPAVREFVATHREARRQKAREVRR